MYVNAQTGAQVDLSELANELNTSIPQQLTVEQLELLGLAVCVDVDRPSPQHTQGSNQFIAGRWTVTWIEPSNDAIIRAYTEVLEGHYDTVAQDHRYDNRFTCALRAGYPGPFQSEGAAFAVWMDECNAHAYAQLAAVLAGDRAKPTADELVSELPPMVWP